MTVFDEVSEISYLKKYNDVFDKEISYFVNYEFSEHKIESEFNEEMLMVNFYNLETHE